MRIQKAIIVISLGALVCGVATAQKRKYPEKSKMPWPPKEAPAVVDISKFFADESLEVTLWAKTPMFYNPTNMDIDPQGRIWINEGVNYREKLGVRRKEGDRIMVLEDTDGDGSADKSHVFHQDPNLECPLGIAVIDNKIIVSQPPEIMVYTDVDRNLKFDPKVDKKVTLLTGFNGRQHDHSLHSVTTGPDGKLYFNAGNCGAIFTDNSGKTFRMNTNYRGGASEKYFYTATHELNGAKSDDGYVWSSGFSVRMDEDGKGVEIIGHGYRNSYEQVVNSFGDMYQSDNDDHSSCRNSYVLEYGSAGYYSLDGQFKWQAEKRSGQAIPRAHWRQDNPGTFDAGDVYGSGGPTGVTFYENGALGEKFNGMYLSCEASRNTIFGYQPKPQGATYTMDRTNFLTTAAPADIAAKESEEEQDARVFFRPSDVCVGPDGALYVADWFDARSGGHSTLDETASGAIYRIAPKGFKSKVPELDLKSVNGMVEVLKNPNPSVRFLGFKALKAEGSKAYGAVVQLLEDKNPYIAARAIWLLPYLGEEGVTKCEALLQDEDDMVRLVAYRSLRRAGKDMLGYAKLLAEDSSAGVRRDVALSLRPYGANEVAELFVTLAKGYDGKDKNYGEALALGAALKEREVWRAIQRGMGQNDATKWSDAFAKLTWHFKTPIALGDLRKRVMERSLTMEQRKLALDSIAFIDDEAAPKAMFGLVEHISDKTLKEEGVQWLVRRGITQWAKYSIKNKLKSSGVFDFDAIQLIPISVVAEDKKAKKMKVADVMKLKGDAKKGASTIMRCTMCHEVKGVGPNYGPRLEGWAAKQTKEATIHAIVNPSKGIAHGFKGTEYVLKDGGVIQGLTEAHGDPAIVMSQGGLTQIIAKNKVKKSANMTRSLMLSAEQLGLSAQDVADIVAFMREWK